MNVARLSEGRNSLEGDLEAISRPLRTARHALALTGAGVSVASGIPDFRSPDGLWSRYDPFVDASFETFRNDPERSWRLFRDIGSTLRGARPNAAHAALARLEALGRLEAVITQNIDGLHIAAGSRTVVELHGSQRELHCIRCGRHAPFAPRHLVPGPVPTCERCGAALKPTVVLFEEPVHRLDDAVALADRCDLLIVAGTSGEIAPASLLPEHVLGHGGSILEFNLAPTPLTASGLGPSGGAVFGRVEATLPLVVEAIAAWEDAT